MKTILLLLVTCAALLAETKTESELRKQLAAAQAALSAERARAAGTEKLVEAVSATTETSKDNSEKIEAVADQIADAQESSQKLEETVKAESAATRTATKKIADAVSVQSNATVTALSSQMKQQERTGIESARELARNLKEANIARDKATADRVAAEERSAARQAKMQKDIDDLKVTADVIADKKDARVQGYAFWTMVVTMVFVPLATAGGIYLTRKVEGVHGMVNGQRTAMEAEIREFKEREHARQVLEALHTTPPKKTAGEGQ